MLTFTAVGSPRGTAGIFLDLYGLWGSGGGKDVRNQHAPFEIEQRAADRSFIRSWEGEMGMGPKAGPSPLPWPAAATKDDEGGVQDDDERSSSPLAGR